MLRRKAIVLVSLLVCLGLTVWLATRISVRRDATEVESEEFARVARLAGPRIDPLGQVQAEADLRSPAGLPTVEEGPDAPRAATSDAEQPGSLRVRISWAEDSSPAANAPVRIIPLGVADSRLNEHEGVADELGELVVGGLRPGSYCLETACGGSTTAQIQAHAETLALIAIPAGARVRGIVVDELGRPVAGAGIWLTYGSFRLIGAVVARTRADGRFELRSVDCSSQRMIGARGAGYAPSASAILTAESGSTVELLLEVGPESGAIRGQVCAVSGEPQQNALIVVGSDRPGDTRLGDGTPALEAPPIRARTDAQGVFLVACAPASLVPVLVRCPGFSPWRREVEVPLHGERELTIVLEAGVSLEGCVWDVDGTPIAGAEVLVGDRSDPTGSLSFSESDGSFRVDSLPAEEFEVRVTSQLLGRASTKLCGEPGQLLRWDPVLEPGGRIAVRVLDEWAMPRRAWTVEVGATVQGEWLSRWGPTDDEGRFVARDCPEASYMLRVSEPGASFAVLQREGLSPGMEETVVRLPSDQLAQGAIYGRLVDCEGAPVEGASVRATRAHDAAPRMRLSKAGSGAFAFDRVPPGEYSLRILAPKQPVLALGPHFLQAGESWDVGELRFERAGSLLLKLHHADGSPIGRPGLYCAQLDGPAHDVPVPDGDGLARSAPLAPGRYRLYVYGEGLVSMTRELEIEAGRETRLELELQSGVFVRLVFLDPPGAPLPDHEMHFRMLGKEREVMAEVDLERRPGTPFQWHVGLPAGSYQLEAVDSGGIVHAWLPVLLRPSGSDAQTIEVQLH